jgi:hypothetical protein
LSWGVYTWLAASCKCRHDLYRSGGRFLCAHEKPGWHANNPPGGDSVEFRIALEKLALTPGSQFGIAFDVTNATGDAKQEWHFWPPTARLDEPASWGTVILGPPG